MLYPVMTSARLVSDLSGIWAFKTDDGTGFAGKCYEKPLADAMWNLRTRNPHADAAKFVKPGKVEDAEAALAGGNIYAVTCLRECAILLR